MNGPEPAMSTTCTTVGRFRYTVGSMLRIERITLDPNVMGGKPCIRGLRLTVGTILGLLAAGRSEGEILDAYPYLEKEDIQAALEDCSL